MTSNFTSTLFVIEITDNNELQIFDFHSIRFNFVVSITATSDSFRWSRHDWWDDHFEIDFLFNNFQLFQTKQIMLKFVISIQIIMCRRTQKISEETFFNYDRLQEEAMAGATHRIQQNDHLRMTMRLKHLKQLYLNKITFWNSIKYKFFFFVILILWKKDNTNGVEMKLAKNHFLKFGFKKSQCACKFFELMNDQHFNWLYKIMANWE